MSRPRSRTRARSLCCPTPAALASREHPREVFVVKLILTHEVDGLGSPGDVVEVKNGYGRNYLLPRGFAIPWTRGGQKQIDLIQRARRSRDIRTLEEARQVEGQINALTVRLKQRAGEGGRLFGSVTPADIAEAVKSSGGLHGLGDVRGCERTEQAA